MPTKTPKKSEELRAELAGILRVACASEVCSSEAAREILEEWDGLSADFADFADTAGQTVLCGECRWWIRDDGRSRLHGCCSPGKREDFYDGEYGEDIPDNGLLVKCDEDWSMVSGPNFGCVHGERKD